MFGSILAALMPIISDVLKKAIPDANERAKAQEEITKGLMANEQAVFDAMKGVMTADSGSDNKLLSSARPIVVYWSLAMISFIAFLGSIGYGEGVIHALERVPSGLWQFVTVGIGAFSLTRGIEKSVKAFKS